MRTIALANNRVGLEGVRILREIGADLAGLVVHPPDSAVLRDEIVAAARVARDAVLEAPELRTEAGLARIRELRAELGASLFFGYILRPDFLDLLPAGVVNVHPALLPWNRGKYPNVWCIVDRTPAGATLHLIDPGVDTGPILARREVEILPWDTGKTLYRRLEDACLELLREEMPAVLAGRATARPQAPGGSFHRARDVEGIDEIDPDATVRAGYLLDLLRARTFPPWRGAFFRTEDGRRVYLRLELEPEEESEP